MGITRAKSAYNYFLSSLKGKTVGMRRRLRTKSTVWRRDLLAMKFASLDPELRAVFDGKARDAKDLVMAARNQQMKHLSGSTGALGHTRGRGEAAPSNAGTPASLGSPPVVEGPPTQITPTDVGGQGANDEADQHADAMAEVEGLAHTMLFTDQSSGLQSSLVILNQALLGAGTYGYCHPVRDEDTGERFCAKFARRSLEVRDVARAALRKEFAALSRMQHPNIVKAHGLSLTFDGSISALLLPLAERNLQSWIHANGPLEPAAWGQMAGQLAGDERSCLLQCIRGIAHMHSRQVIHLDVKPGNVLVSGPQSQPVCQLADFGQCRCLEAADGIPDEVLKASWVNSRDYRPVELFSMGSATVHPRKRYDLWAFGCIIYEVAASSNPRTRGTNRVVAPLFNGVKMDGQVEHVISGREYRLNRCCPSAVKPVVVLCQPRSAHKQSQTTAIDVLSRLRDLRAGPLVNVQ